MVRLAIESVEVASIDVSVPNTIGQHGPDYPTLRVMLDCKLLPFRPHNGPPQPVTMLSLRGLLMLGNIRIAEHQSAPNIYADRVENPRQQVIPVELPLDAFRIARIEAQRVGDFSGVLHLEVVFAVHGDTTRFMKVDSFDLRLDLPQSHWTAKVLPGLGYHEISIVELPFPAAMVEEFRTGAGELRRAVTHFTEGRPADAVAACRSAIQAVINSRPTEKAEDERNGFPAAVDRFSEQHLASLSRSKRNHFRTMATSLWSLASIPHHPGTENHFEREDAELIIRETTAFLSYAGKVLR